eukprot:2981416-Rhodomonas_salina.1
MGRGGPGCAFITQHVQALRSRVAGSGRKAVCVQSGGWPPTSTSVSLLRAATCAGVLPSLPGRASVSHRLRACAITPHIHAPRQGVALARRHAGGDPAVPTREAPSWCSRRMLCGCRPPAATWAGVKPAWRSGSDSSSRLPISSSADSTSTCPPSAALCAAVNPPADAPPTSTPAIACSACSAATCPAPAATMAGVSPRPLRADMSAPSSASTRRHATCPCSAARWAGSAPSTLACATAGSAPLSQSTRTVPACPASLATCSAEQPRLSALAPLLAPHSHSTATASSCPPAAA